VKESDQTELNDYTVSNRSVERWSTHIFQLCNFAYLIKLDVHLLHINFEIAVKILLLKTNYTADSQKLFSLVFH
jgi:hypothetical protein